MKITVIYGTNRTEKSSTYNIARQFIEELADDDTVTEFHLPRDMPVFCTGCLTCLSDSTKCPHYKYVQPIEEAMETADLIIFTTPVYLLHVPGQVKALLDHFGFQWMAHKPKDVYFHKQALVISTGARIGIRQTVRDVRNSLDWWGVGRVYRFKKTVGMKGWRGLSDKKRAKFAREIKQTSRKIRQQTGAKPRLKVMMIFYLMRFAQKKFWSDEPQAVYWKENGWFAGKKPWKTS